ncbi:MAG: serine O-acetyltransferase [Pseudomonadota bacterium]
MFQHIKEEIQTIIKRDPAARNSLEVILCYPSFHAILAHRLSHFLWSKKFKLIARFLSHIARLISGIEIHPGAVIGKNLFIDHGFGVVIGETCVIANDVTLYQGVTLGGISPSLDSASQRDKKRHPTLLDNVIIGSGAQILGPITINRCARVGANAVVVKDVKERTTVVGIPAHEIDQNTKQEEEKKFAPYGLTSENLPDPITQQLANIEKQMLDLQIKLQGIDIRKNHLNEEPNKTNNSDQI